MTKLGAGMVKSGGRFVAFTIGSSEFAVSINDVREIRAWSGATPLPNAPAFILGVMNLRGAIVPIVDVRYRFGMGQTEPTRLHVVIVSAIGDHPVGLLVDGVSDILDAAAEDVRPLPDEAAASGAGLLGVLTYKDSLAGIVDVTHLADGAQLRQAA
jgi:purine-binding chemotaxis protein CheW